MDLFLMDFVTEEVDEGKHVGIFFLDFVKAFDKVPWQRLVKKNASKLVDSDLDQLESS